jgi:D-glucuronyl C5-epimerase C-terminus
MSRVRSRVAACAALTGVLAVAIASAAQASPIIRVDKDGRAHKANDRFLPPREATRLPAVPRGTRVARVARMARAAITGSTNARADYEAALADARRLRDALTGTPRDELGAAIATAEGIDARGELSDSRVAALVLTLRRNAEFWAANLPPAPGTRVVFTGSPVILEYYVGRGLQIQPLANFGKANAYWSSCRSRADHTCPKLRTMLDAMLALTSQRGAFNAWEYFFEFEGGSPPWMSGMAQGTGIQALSRAFQLTGDARYRDAAVAALGAFETLPPVGVARPATNGTHYLTYSYAPDLFIFNGFLQSLVGLDDYRDVTGDWRGTTLFRAGHYHAKWLVPFSDTGSWSLYSLGGRESPLEYHVLLRDILSNLCKRIGTAVYCDTAQRFSEYLLTWPT